MSMLAAPDELTAADLDRDTNQGRIYRLHRATMAGRDTCSGACETRSGCDCIATQCPPCHGHCHQGRACNASQAEPSRFFGSGYGDDMHPAAPAVPVPCSTLARWWLTVKRWLS